MGLKYRCTQFFAGGLSGWSESLVFDSDLTSPGAVATQLLGMTQDRCKMLGDGYQMSAYSTRLQQSAGGVAVKGSGFLTLCTALTHPSSQYDGDPNFVTAKVLLSDDVGTEHATIMLGGIPDACTLSEGQFSAAGAGFGASFNQWAVKVVANRGGWWSYPQTGDVRITNYTTLNNFFAVGTVDAGAFAALTVGQSYPARIRKVNGRSNLNGQQKIIVLSANTFALQSPIATAEYSSVGFIKVYARVPTYMRAPGIQLSASVGRHKRGRPFSQSRGRLPARPRY